MLADEAQRRQHELIAKIYKLSENICDTTEVRRIALELKEIYSSDFRHSYSDFFPVILHILKEDNNYSTDYLSENLESLRKYVEKDYLTGKNEFEAMHKVFDKLCDHLNLELGRVAYYSQSEKKTEDLSKRMETTNKEMDLATEALEIATKKAGSMQTELISVVSVFAAIVITFSGGISFISGTISSASDTYICKLVLLLLICGIVLFNTIFFLMYLVGKLIGRSVFAECEAEYCTCKNGNNPKCREIVKVRKRLPYVFYFNITILVFIIIDIAIWCLDRWIF